MSHPESELVEELPQPNPPLHPEFKMPPLDGYRGTPEEIEQQWLDQAYKGHGDRMPQLTWRSTLLGCILGAVMAAPNMYLGLKSGVLMGVSLTCTLMGFIFWQMLLKMRLVRGKLSVLEYNAMASTASAAGYTTIGVLVSAIAAYVLLNDKPMAPGWLALWVLCVALLGVTMAIPMKRQIINVDQLPFPGSIASAETLQLLVAESHGSIRSARALIVAAVIGAMDTLWASLAAISERMRGFGWIGHRTAESLGRASSQHGVDLANQAMVPGGVQVLSVKLAWDGLFFASGPFMGLRMCITLVVSGTLCWGIYVPLMRHAGHIHGSTIRDFMQFTLWGAASCMIVSGLVAVAFQWRAFVKAFRTLWALVDRRQVAPTPSPMAGLEAPLSWFFIGQIIAAAGLVVVGEKVVGIPWWQTLLAVALSFFLAMITCRICGETGQSQHSAMSKVTQFTFGAMNPVKPEMTSAQKIGQMDINLLSAGITTGAACNAADLLSDLKVGYFLGAHPRKQFLAQFIGIFVGVLVSVVLFTALVPKKTALTGRDTYKLTWGDESHRIDWVLSEAAAGKVQPVVAEDGKPASYILPVDDAVVKEMQKVGITLDNWPSQIEVVAHHIEPKFPAPSAWAWKGIAEAVAGGWQQMPTPKRWTMFGGALVGLLLALLPKVFPKTVQWAPSPGVVASGWLFFWWMSFMMFIGALAAWIWQKTDRRQADQFLVPIASGIFVGGSLMGVGVSFFTDGPEIIEALRAAFGG